MAAFRIPPFLGFGVGLVVVAVGVYIWSDLSKPPKIEVPPVSAISRPVATPAVTPMANGSGQSTPAAATPPTTPSPAPRAISAVAPGMPMVVTTPKPFAPRAGAISGGRPDPISEPRNDLEKVHSMLRDYRTRMGENPVGSNAEIMKQVMGGNEAGARLGPPEGQSLNADGELVDRWGHPYFFHAVSKNKMEIRSAGPDGKMWTADDVVGR